MKLNVQGLARKAPELMRGIRPAAGNKVVSIDLCFPPEVEYLTPRGWVHVCDLKPRDKVWSVERDTRIGKFEIPTRKIKKRYNGDMYWFKNSIGVLPVTEGHRLLFAGRRRAVDGVAGGNLPKSPKMYTTSTNQITTEISTVMLGLAMAVIRYGIIDESGYSVRIGNAEHREEFARLLKRRGVERHGWEKWASVLSSPIVRGFNLDLSSVGGNQVGDMISLFRFWLSGHELTKQQVDQFQAYFSRSGVTCASYDGGVTGFNTDSLEITSTWSTQYSGEVYCVSVGNTYLLVRHAGACFVTGNCAGEPSITAHFSGDKNYRYAVYDGVGKEPYFQDDGLLMIDDIYLMTMSRSPIGKKELHELAASSFNGVPFSKQWVLDKEVPLAKIKPMRSTIKAWALGLGYGMSARALPDHAYNAGYQLSPQDAKAFHSAFWKTFSGVKAFSTRMTKIVERQGYIINPFGYRCTPEPHKAFNAFIQSSVSGLINVLCMKLFTIAKYARLVTIIHDELLVEVPEHLVQQLQADLDVAVKSLNEDLGWSIDMRTGFVVGGDWYEAK